MRILIIADEVWNDKIYGNNVLTNWFDGFQADFAEIYCSPGTPNNKCCETYFQLTDAMMAKSLITRKKAGLSFSIRIVDMLASFRQLSIHQGSPRFYKFMKSITVEAIRAVRDLIWLYGRYDMVELNKFVKTFNPDVIFCPRLSTPKLLRLEKIVSHISNAPMIAFTGDDEASFMQVSYDPIYWIRRWLFNKAFIRNIKIYQHYFMHSAEQAAYYHENYGVSTSVLFKGGKFDREYHGKETNRVIKLVYAGRLYCNRWQTLSAIGDALKIINGDTEKMILEIYTQERLTKKQCNSLSEKKHIYVKGSVDPQQLKDIYENSDIALHVESFDKKYRYATKVSFSTKIIDLMASSCAIMAICWDQHTGYTYLKRNDAALCVSSYNAILPLLQLICEKPQIIEEYAIKAWECGNRNHQKDDVQKYIMEVFNKVISESKR